jgi:hypothetical protein
MQCIGVYGKKAGVYDIGQDMTAVDHLHTSLSLHSDSNGFSLHHVLTCLLLSKAHNFRQRSAGPQTTQAMSIVDALRANCIILLVFASLTHWQLSNSNQRRNGHPTLKTCYIWGIKRSQRLPRYIQDPEMTPIRTPPPGAAQPPNPPDPAKSIDQTSQSLPIPFSRVPASAQGLQLQPFLL